MARSRHHLKKRQVGSAAALVKMLAPEDIQRGDFVTVLSAVAELPSYLWCADAYTLPVHELIRIEHVPLEAGLPMKVKSVCLPFVLVKLPCGTKQRLDVRLCQLARLEQAYAHVTWKAYRAKPKRRKPGRKRK